MIPKSTIIVHIYILLTLYMYIKMVEIGKEIRFECACTRKLYMSSKTKKGELNYEQLHTERKEIYLFS